MPISSDYRYIKKSPNTEDLNLSHDSGHGVQSRQSHATQTKHKKPRLNLRVCTEKSLCDDCNLLISCLNLFMDKIISFLIGKSILSFNIKNSLLLSAIACHSKQVKLQSKKSNLSFPCFVLPSRFKYLQAFYFNLVFFLSVQN